MALLTAVNIFIRLQKSQTIFLNLKFIAEWYPLTGGMQDFNYWRYGCMELTMEVSCCKYPPAIELESYWSDNKKSLIEYLKLANTGVRGIVSFDDGTPAKYVTVKIDQRDPFFKTNSNGEFYRILLPGRYTLSVALNCSNVYQATIEVPRISQLLELKIKLSRNVHERYQSSLLNRYPIFCNKSDYNGSIQVKAKFTFISLVVLFVLFIL